MIRERRQKEFAFLGERFILIYLQQLLELGDGNLIDTLEKSSGYKESEWIRARRVFQNFFLLIIIKKGEAIDTAEAKLFIVSRV